VKHADRLQHVNEYYFSEKLREIQSLVEQGKPIINLGIGNPDLPPPPQAIEAMHQALDDVSKHGYQPLQRDCHFAKCHVGFLSTSLCRKYRSPFGNFTFVWSQRRHHALIHGLSESGDAVLVPNPGYASYSAIAHLLEAQIIPYDLKAELHWYPDFEQLKRRI
jgi:LL-diaminopimelate aminotransferase